LLDLDGRQVGGTHESVELLEISAQDFTQSLNLGVDLPRVLGRQLQ
jgi:hypothetical protein